MNDETLIMGGVAYSPKVVTIWEGFRAYLAQHDLKFDIVLYTNYERQVLDLFKGNIHIAWNSPLAWIRCKRIAEAQGVKIRPLVMRDTDRDLSSVFIVNNDSPIQNLNDLRGNVLGTGALDSPQATIIPLYHLRRLGLIADQDFNVCRFDILSGKHGDHVGGERDAVLALLAGAVDVCCIYEGNYRAFLQDGTLKSGNTRVVGKTDLFDHCNFTAGPSAPPAITARFTELILSMRWEDPQVRPLLELEGLREWLPGRTQGYDLLEAAVTDLGFYSTEGAVQHPEYDYA